MNLYHHIKWLIVSDSDMTYIPRHMSNDDSNTEFDNDVESDSEVNVVEMVNVSDVDILVVE